MHCSNSYSLPQEEVLGTYALLTRVMIVQNLQSPIYLGQDIFSSKHLFYALTNEHMIMKGKSSLLYTPYVKEETTTQTCSTIQAAPDQLKWFTTRSIILPSQRTTNVRVTHTQNQALKPDSTVEVHPCSQSTLPNGLHMVPTINICLLYTSPSPRDKRQSRMPSSA